MTAELTAHYAATIRLIEQLLLRRLPRLPLMPTVVGLGDYEVDVIARRLAEAHDIAATVTT